MKQKAAIIQLISSTVCALFTLSGCGTPEAGTSEKGPDGTIAYYVQIESSDPGVRVEANQEYAGKTPLTLKIYGDKDGTFHNFGSQQYIIRAFPNSTNQYIQTRTFRTGGWFSQEDMVPKRIYFDMDHKTSGFSVEVPPRY